jgi:hypothetical protein
MVYFALTRFGEMHNLGDHKDIDGADFIAEDMKINAVMLFDEYEAKEMANYINTELQIIKDRKP